VSIRIVVLLVRVVLIDRVAVLRGLALATFLVSRSTIA
jgi:hypothetical protein